jgi:SAM-dependent methyltransferase
VERFYSFKPDLSGMVLEVGSDLQGAVLKELKARGVRHVVGLNVAVDSEVHSSRGNGPERYEILRGDVRRLPFADASISAMLSITAFEHVTDLDVALREMHRVLKPGGLLYSDFGPLWSGSVGHHVYAVVNGVEARHFKPGKNPVPHFAHLLLSPEELRTAVLQKDWVFPTLADAIVDWIHGSGDLNRLFYEEYIGVFEASPFTIRHLAPVREHVPRSTQKRLEAACPGFRDFGVRMVEVVLEKAR